MEKFLISVDMDDTFLTKDKTITQESIEFVKKLVSDGHHFIINTGRPHQGAISFLKSLGIHEPMIVNNGGAIVYYDENYQNVVDYHLFNLGLKGVIDFNKKIEHTLNCGTVTSIFDFYTTNLDKTPFWVIHRSENVKIHEGPIYTNLNTLPFLSEYYVKEEFEKEFEKVLSQTKYKNWNITKWGNFDGQITYEISSKNANKGKAMLYLAKKLKIKKENIISFGDQLNDIPMLMMANYGVAMINSRDEVKEKAKFISEFDYNNNGVIEFIKKIIK